MVLDELNIYACNSKADFERIYRSLETYGEKYLSDTHGELLGSSIKTESDKVNPYKHLHHGITFINDYAILKYFLRIHKVVPGKNIPFYKASRMNSNEGKYISMLLYDNKKAYDKYIRDNLSIMVKPSINPLEVVVVNEYMYEYIMKNHKNHKNRYSFVKGEYHSKAFDTEYIDSIGIPFTLLSENYSKEYALKYLKKILLLLKRYNLSLPIYDSSNHNFDILYSSKDDKLSIL